MKLIEIIKQMKINLRYTPKMICEKKISFWNILFFSSYCLRVIVALIKVIES